IPAWLSYRFVENPIRFSRRLTPTRPALVAGGALSAVSGVVGVLVIASFSLANSIPVATAAEAPGAAVLIDAKPDAVDWSKVDHVEVMRADPTVPDLPRIYSHPDCVVEGQEERQDYCEFGDKDSDRTVV